MFTLYTKPVVYLYLSQFQRRLYRRAVVAEELPSVSARGSAIMLAAAELLPPLAAFNGTLSETR